ncbi:MAG: L,D-transpeptidase family protein [Acidimicrobiales bacterium]
MPRASMVRVGKWLWPGQLKAPGRAHPAYLLVAGAAVLGAAAICAAGCAPMRAAADSGGAAPHLAVLDKGVPREEPVRGPAVAPRHPPVLEVIRVTPGDKATGVGPSAPVVVTYNQSLGLAARYPVISPPVPGRWQRTGPAQVEFKPTGYWEPGTTYRVSLPVPLATSPGARGVSEFSTGLPSVLALQQYLAILGYLPLRFTPTGDQPNRWAVLRREPTSPDLVPQAPSPGVFTWAYPDVPELLWAQWHRGQPNVVTTGAVMQFEVAHGLVPDGTAGAALWRALLRAVASRQMDARHYNYVIVSETLPETLYVWQDGKFVYHTLANTGVPGAATPQGTWPVAYKQNPNLMKGCDVNGTCYSVWVDYASYFIPSVGDAVHAFSRPGYGYPQSNGCVEVAPSQGAIVYGYDPVGTLVTVSSWVGPAQGQ